MAIQTLHDHKLSVLGDAVLNHRCAQFQGPNGVWNQFGGKLDWDQRAIVGDDPTFQGQGNGSSGESFGAAPNIDHSQEFVKKDLTEWMQWLRQEVRAQCAAPSKLPGVRALPANGRMRNAMCNCAPRRTWNPRALLDTTWPHWKTRLSTTCLPLPTALFTCARPRLTSEVPCWRSEESCGCCWFGFFAGGIRRVAAGLRARVLGRSREGVHGGHGAAVRRR